ncbi:hypothetical protein SFC23_18795 [Shouchella clausii]|uniref:hypothetical protein n=1 Tax=Shouchella clausii TaxID=79880 RepID=UPI003983CBE2
MTKTKLLVCTLALTLSTTPILANVSYASTIPQEKVSTFDESTIEEELLVEFSEDKIVYPAGYYEKVEEEIDGELYIIETIGYKDHYLLNVTNNEGTMSFINNYNSDKVELESDFLPEDELQEIENELESIVEITDVEAVEDEDMMITPFAQTGSWRLGNWVNKQVTPNGKATTQIIIGALGSLGGVKGAMAAAIVNIFIQYNLKTGYFKKRFDTRKDTNANYIWYRTSVKTYSDKARTKLLGSHVGTPTRHFIGI